MCKFFYCFVVTIRCKSFATWNVVPTLCFDINIPPKSPFAKGGLGPASQEKVVL